MKGGLGGGWFGSWLHSVSVSLRVFVFRGSGVVLWPRCFDVSVGTARHTVPIKMFSSRCIRALSCPPCWGMQAVGHVSGSLPPAICLHLSTYQPIYIYRYLSDLSCVPPPLIPPSTPHLSSNSLTHGTLCWPHQATLHLTHSTTRSPLPGHPRHVPPHLRRLPARPGGADAPHRALLNGHARARQVWGPFVFLLGPFISCLARSCPDVGLSVPVVVCCQTPRTSTAGGRVRVGLLLVR